MKKLLVYVHVIQSMLTKILDSLCKLPEGFCPLVN